MSHEVGQRGLPEIVWKRAYFGSLGQPAFHGLPRVLVRQKASEGFVLQQTRHKRQEEQPKEVGVVRRTPAKASYCSRRGTNGRSSPKKWASYSWKGLQTPERSSQSSCRKSSKLHAERSSSDSTRLRLTRWYAVRHTNTAAVGDKTNQCGGGEAKRMRRWHGRRGADACYYGGP